MSLKESIKNYAYEIGADLIGFGNIERCANAPVMMSPQGLYPGAESVIVMALHHPDACIELGGESHPQEIGPYSVQYLMNSRLDELSYRMATFIEMQGYGAMPIAASNIWRYNQYKGLKAVFSPDISHIYMAAVAGLADIGYSGLALTPEHGPRNRFVTVITDAKIAPETLIPPGTVCDNCMLCRKNCPTAALEKEIDGDKVIRIENYEYRFADKNLWRCAWGEHFDLDLDLEIPEKVDEQVIINNVRKHGLRSGEMGQCLKFCLPEKVRSFDKNYSRSPVRRIIRKCNGESDSHEAADRMLAKASEQGAEFVIFSSAGELKEQGIELTEKLPGAESAITVVITNNRIQGNTQADKTDALFKLAAGYQVDSICYSMTRGLEETGFRSVMSIGSSGSHYVEMKDASISEKIVNTIKELKNEALVSNTVITRKKINSRKPEFTKATDKLPTSNKRSTLTSVIADFAKSVGADLVGVSSASRLTDIILQIKSRFEGEEILVAVDKATPFSKWVPQIKTEKRKVYIPEDYLPGAKSVIVIGLRYHNAVLKHATKPPAEAVGPYAFQTYITNWLGKTAGVRIAKKLESYGYRAVVTADLAHTGSFIANPRGPQEDTFSNRFAAVAAGLGHLKLNGRVATPEFGIRQRFIAVITDAELEQSSLQQQPQDDLCSTCEKACVSSCPSKALTEKTISFECEDNRYRFYRIDNKLCDWCKRYALMTACGFGFLGSTVNENPGRMVTEEKLNAALKKIDSIKKYRPVVAEPCVLNCPYANADLKT